MCAASDSRLNDAICIHRRPTLYTSLQVAYATLGACAVVKLLRKRWWISIGARLEGPKLESEGRTADVGFPTADQGFSSIQGTLFGFNGI